MYDNVKHCVQYALCSMQGTVCSMPCREVGGEWGFGCRCSLPRSSVQCAAVYSVMLLRQVRQGHTCSSSSDARGDHIMWSTWGGDKDHKGWSRSQLSCSVVIITRCCFSSNPFWSCPSNFYQMMFQGEFDCTLWSCIDAKCCLIEMIKTYITIMNVSTTFGQP